MNNTDEDLLQEAMLIAYLEVERCRYEPRVGVPSTAYVKGIARNKIREARRRERSWMPLDQAVALLLDGLQRQLESAIEWREQQRVLQPGMARLPLQRRQVLEGYFRGQGTTEIEAELKKSAGRVHFQWTSVN